MWGALPQMGVEYTPLKGPECTFYRGRYQDHLCWPPCAKAPFSFDLGHGNPYLSFFVLELMRLQISVYVVGLIFFPKLSGSCRPVMY